MMELLEVTTAALEKEFIQIAVVINTQNPCYIRPLDDEIIATFDPQRNKHFADGKSCRWILQEDGKTIGRIAAFYYKAYKNYGTDFATGCFGFFECINQQAAANMLLTQAQQWLQQHNMSAMDGPVNFGDRDKWWGLLVNGFDEPPYYGMSFNPKYYEKLLENFGLKNYYNQYYFHMNITDHLPQKYVERYQRFLEKTEYSARHLDLHQLQKYAEDFSTIYNSAWSQHHENKTITPSAILKTFRQMKSIIDPHLIWFAYYKEMPIAMWINIPDLNEYFKYCNGKMGLWQKIKIFFLKNTGSCKRFAGIAFGVVPKFQRLGVDAFVICAGAKQIQKEQKYTDYEMGWTSEWNPRMLNMYQSIGSTKSRHMVTYRKIFDEAKHPFARHPEIDYTK